MLYRSFDAIAHSLRILMEFHWKNSELLEIDIEEGVGNMIMGCTTVLNAYHNMYDAMQKHCTVFNWYEHPETAVILLIRNARHHNHCYGIRDYFSHHLMKVDNPEEFRKYKFVDFESTNNGVTYPYYISWDDFMEYLNMPSSESKIKQNTKDIVLDYLNATEMDKMPVTYGLTRENIFFNLIPLLINSFRVLYRELIKYIDFDTYKKSTEVEALLITASEDAIFDTRNHVVEYCEWSF